MHIPLTCLTGPMLIGALLAASPAGAGGKDEVLLKTCFPKEDHAPRKWEECKNEDCGLRDDVQEARSAPTVKKGQQYTFLGGTDLGMIWGATDYRVIGKDQVRFLLYIVTTVTTKTHFYREQPAPIGIVRSVFYSSFGAYPVSQGVMTEPAERSAGRHTEVMGGEGDILMADLHCAEHKMKVYDNMTLYYRTVADTAPDSSCVELLWEKPMLPLPWRNASSMTMNILTRYYCGKR